MFGFLSRRRRMIGGLYFGPAGWIPSRAHAVSARQLRIAIPAASPDALAALHDRSVHAGETILPSTAPDVPAVIAPADGILSEAATWDDPIAGPQRGVTLHVRSTDNGSPPTAVVTPPGDAAGLADMLRKAGIGRTSPRVPALLAQLQALTVSRPRTLIINLLPTQPESALPHALLHHDADRMLTGIKVLRKAIPARRVLVTIDRLDRATLRTLKRGLRGSRVQIVRLLNKYPKADPTVLIHRLLGYILPVDALPTTLPGGIVLVDPVSVWAIGGYATKGEPLVRRPVEIFCPERPPQLVLALLGTPLEALAAHDADHDDTPAGPRQTIINGMLSGVEAPPSAVVTTATESVSFRPLPAPEPASACIACGWCVDLCPTALVPLRLHDLSLTRNGANTAEAADALNCIACGLCSYVCPTRLPLTPYIVDLRNDIRQRRAARPPATPEENAA